MNDPQKGGYTTPAPALDPTTFFEVILVFGNFAKFRRLIGPLTDSGGGGGGIAFSVHSVFALPLAYPQPINPIPTSVAGVRAVGSRVLGCNAWSDFA